MLGWSPTLGGKTEQVGAFPSVTRGTVLTASATAGVKGSWVSLGTTTCPWARIGYALSGHVSSTPDYGVDVAIGDGTNFTMLIPDLRISASLNWTSSVSGTLPIRVPAGATLYARCAASAGSSEAYLCLRGGPGLLGSPGFASAVSLYTPSSQRGASVDPGGTANTKSAWVQLTTGVTQRAGALLLHCGTNNDTARTAMSWLVDVGLGASGSQQIVLADLPLSCFGTSAQLSPWSFGPFACDVPASTAIWARAACSSTTAGDRTLDVSLHGLVV